MTRVIGTAGHVDHGKSTLVKALTGIDPDRLAEEKARAMTIDLGFAWFTLPNGEAVGIVDVPGHRDFIENMLAGIGGIDLALLVIAADEGIMPQTREHLAILDLLEIPGGVVALTKFDAVTEPEWLDLVSADVRGLLHATPLETAPIIPVSARTGYGLDSLVTALQTALEDRPPRLDRGRPRLPVDRIFTMSGFGTVVTGTLSGGSLSVGDEIQVIPSGEKARVRGLQSHKETIQSARPGSRVAINIGGLDRDHIQRGDVITLPGSLAPTQLVDVRFRHLRDSRQPLMHNAAVKFFSGAAEVQTQVRLVGDRELAPGAEGWLQLRLEKPLGLDKGDHFILRQPSPGETIGGGTVLDPHPAHRWRRFKPEVVARFETLALGSPDEVLLNLLESRLILPRDHLQAEAGLDQAQATQALEALLAQGAVLEIGDGWLIARARWERLAGQIARELAAYHTANPLKSGMSREALRSRLEIDPRVFNRLISLASEQSVVIDAGPLLRLPDHRVQFSREQQAAIGRLRAAIAANPTLPPSVKESEAMVGSEVLQALFEQAELIQVSQDVLFDAATYERLIRDIRSFITGNGSITVAQARDQFQTSRKYALALLEHLDSIDVTQRVGDERILRQANE